MNIGITSNFEYGFYCNGLQQNIVLLYEALEKIGFNPIFIDYSGSGNRKPRVQLERITSKKIIDQFQVHKNHFDMILFPGISCNSDTRKAAFKKNPNCRLVSIKYGNNLLTDIHTVFSDSKTDFVSWDYGDEFVDVTLVSPHYQFAESYFELIEGCRTGIIPYIWDPSFIEDTAKTVGLTLKYRPTLRPNIAVLEPNLNFTKNCLIPVLSISKVLLENPKCINKSYIYCSDHVINDEDRKDVKDYLLNATPIFNHPNRVYFEGRIKTPFILHRKNPLILSFQHLNALNYIYLEALYLNYPLVHNSEMMTDAGYYYEDFDINECAKKIEQASEQHNDTLKDYEIQSNDTVYKYSINNPEVLKNIESTIISCTK